LKASSQALKVRPAGVSGIVGGACAGAWGIARGVNAAAKAKTKAKHDLENDDMETMEHLSGEWQLASLNSDTDCHD